MVHALTFPSSYASAVADGDLVGDGVLKSVDEVQAALIAGSAADAGIASSSSAPPSRCPGSDRRDARHPGEADAQDRDLIPFAEGPARPTIAFAVAAWQRRRTFAEAERAAVALAEAATRLSDRSTRPGRIGDEAARHDAEGADMAVVRIDRVGLGPAHVAELIARRATLISVIRRRTPAQIRRPGRQGPSPGMPPPTEIVDER